MTYTKPQLSGYMAMSVIQGSDKGQTTAETSPGLKTPPAYEADE